MKRKFTQSEDGVPRITVTCKVRLDKHQAGVLEAYARSCDLPLETLITGYAADECERQVEEILGNEFLSDY